MFDFWEALKYVIKEKISQFKLGVRRFFCKHHYVEEKNTLAWSAWNLL